MYRILIVDDDVLMCRALEVMIKKVGDFEICGTASTGKAGIELFEKEVPDIVFSDILMPGLSGMEMIAEIRQKSEDTTIYLLSSYTNFDLAREAVKLKVNEYLIKPVSINAITDLLTDYKTSREGSISSVLSGLEDIIGRGDFKEAYRQTDRVTEFLYKDYGKDVSEALRYMGQKLLSGCGVMDGQMKDVEGLFPLNEALVVDERIGYMWLFKVVNYVFEQNAVRRYPVLQNVFSYIDANIHEELGLSQITENCAISQGYLSRIFKSRFNISVMEYIHLRKIHLAKGYLYLTKDSVADVAFRLGYNESSYFCKVFKKYENMTVQQYKKTVLC